MPETKVDGYQTYRLDKNYRSSNEITGGGCLVALKDSYYISQIPSADHGVEHIFAKWCIHKLIMVKLLNWITE